MTEVPMIKLSIMDIKDVHFIKYVKKAHRYATNLLQKYFFLAYKIWSQIKRNAFLYFQVHYILCRQNKFCTEVVDCFAKGTCSKCQIYYFKKYIRFSFIKILTVLLLYSLLFSSDSFNLNNLLMSYIWRTFSRCNGTPGILTYINRRKWMT